MNEFHVVGICQNEPERKLTAGGISYTQLLVESTRPYKNAAGVAETDLFSVTVWKTLADECLEHVRKGSAVAIKGRVQANNYTKDDDIYYRCDLVGEKVAVISDIM